MTWIKLPIKPFSAPRQTRKDSWDPRPVVLDYRSWKDALRLHINKLGGPEAVERDGVIGVRFRIGMTEGWSKKKKALHDGKQHQNKPDLDNLIKAYKDALFKEDSHIHRYDPYPEKTWTTEPCIEVWID